MPQPSNPFTISLFPVNHDYPFAMGVIDWIHTIFAIASE